MSGLFRLYFLTLLFLVTSIHCTALTIPSPEDQIAAAKMEIRDQLESKFLKRTGYNEALFWAKKRNKKILVYFNGDSYVNCSKYRDRCWNYDNLTFIDSTYEFLNLNIEERKPYPTNFRFYSKHLKDSVRTYGQFYQHQLIKEFGKTHVPFYLILNADGSFGNQFYDNGRTGEFNFFLKNEPVLHESIVGIWEHVDFEANLFANNSLHEANNLTQPYKTLVIKNNGDVHALRGDRMEADYYSIGLASKTGNVFNLNSENDGPLQFQFITNNNITFNLVKSGKSYNYKRCESCDTLKELGYFDIYQPTEIAIGNWLKGTYKIPFRGIEITITFNENLTLTGHPECTRFTVHDFANETLLDFRSEDNDTDKMHSYIITYKNGLLLTPVENVIAKIWPEKVKAIGNAFRLTKIEEE